LLHQNGVLEGTAKAGEKETTGLNRRPWYDICRTLPFVGKKRTRAALKKAKPSETSTSPWRSLLLGRRGKAYERERKGQTSTRMKNLLRGRGEPSSVATRSSSQRKKHQGRKGVQYNEVQIHQLKGKEKAILLRITHVPLKEEATRDRRGEKRSTLNYLCCGEAP